MKLIKKYSLIEMGKNELGQDIIIFHENLRFIDLNNLNKYTVSELISIFGGKIGNARKKDYINAILSRRKDKIMSDNREIKLKSLLGI
jgi:hypothetical protein